LVIIMPQAVRYNFVFHMFLAVWKPDTRLSMTNAEGPSRSSNCEEEEKKQMAFYATPYL
jgi:hypothetical protein